MSDQIIGTLFGILQAVLIAGIGGALKLWSDVRILKKDVDEAHRKIRELAACQMK